MSEHTFESNIRLIHKLWPALAENIGAEQASEWRNTLRTLNQDTLHTAIRRTYRESEYPTVKLKNITDTFNAIRREQRQERNRQAMFDARRKQADLEYRQFCDDQREITARLADFSDEELRAVLDEAIGHNAKLRWLYAQLPDEKIRFTAGPRIELWHHLNGTANAAPTDDREPDINRDGSMRGETLACLMGAMLSPVERKLCEA